MPDIRQLVQDFHWDWNSSNSIRNKTSWDRRWCARNFDMWLDKFVHNEAANRMQEKSWAAY